jgi:hypothetical protein
VDEAFVPARVACEAKFNSHAFFILNPKGRGALFLAVRLFNRPLRALLLASLLPYALAEGQQTMTALSRAPVQINFTR